MTASLQTVFVFDHRDFMSLIMGLFILASVFFIHEEGHSADFLLVAFSSHFLSAHVLGRIVCAEN